MLPLPLALPRSAPLDIGAHTHNGGGDGVTVCAGFVSNAFDLRCKVIQHANRLAAIHTLESLLELIGELLKIGYIPLDDSSAAQVLFAQKMTKDCLDRACQLESCGRIWRQFDKPEFAQAAEHKLRRRLRSCAVLSDPFV